MSSDCESIVFYVAATFSDSAPTFSELTSALSDCRVNSFRFSTVFFYTNSDFESTFSSLKRLFRDSGQLFQTQSQIFQLRVNFFRLRVTFFLFSGDFFGNNAKFSLLRVNFFWFNGDFFHRYDIFFRPVRRRLFADQRRHFPTMSPLFPV